MFRSPRFSDIFGSKPVRVRSGDEPKGAAPRQPGTDAEAVWLEITAAHRRAALAFTPERIKAADLAQDES